MNAWELPDRQSEHLEQFPEVKAALLKTIRTHSEGICLELLQEREKQVGMGYTPNVDLIMNTSPFTWIGYINKALMSWHDGGFPECSDPETLARIRRAFVIAPASLRKAL
jgi:hypothetical protein